MMPLFDRRSGTARSKWRYRNLLMLALLTFCVVQVFSLGPIGRLAPGCRWNGASGSGNRLSPSPAS
jgi:hypothetical protein